MQNNKLPLLFREQLELEISQVDLLMGMYPSDDELIIDDTTRDWLDLLRDWTATDRDDSVIEGIPATLSFELIVQADLDNHNSQSTVLEEQQKLHLHIDVPVRTVKEAHHPDNKDSSQPSLKVRLRQPPWLTRSQTTAINTSIPPSISTDVFATIDHFRTEAAYHHSTAQTNNSSTPTTTTHPLPLTRVWFYFPSLSTRAKRTDLVTNAPRYSLTGFVLAGKPGILCLEGSSPDIDSYMRFIKTESWGDIPSHQKKVSERFREDLDPGMGRERVFEGMREITDCEFMGERRGERGNRGDLRALEEWLDGFGLKGIVGRVLM